MFLSYNPNASPGLLKDITRSTVDARSWNLGTGIFNLDRYVRPDVVTHTPRISFNGSTYTLGTIDLTATGVFRGRSVYVVVNRFNAANVRTRLGSQNVNINASGTGTYTLNHTFSQNERIEVLVFESSAFQQAGLPMANNRGLISSQIVRPTLIAF